MEPTTEVPFRASHRTASRRISPVLVLLSLAGVLLIGGGIGAVVVMARGGSGDPKPPAPGPAGSSQSISGAQCDYLPASDPRAGQPAPTPAPRPTLLLRPHITINTNRGDMEVFLFSDVAPCTVNSFLTLARAGFYDKTECHRLTTDQIFVLQCGDPGGTGQGGPGYRYGDENLPTIRKPAYPRGTLAMANAGPGTNGSQFFLVYRDSDIDPNYTVFGTVTRGLDVLDQIAAGGADDSNGTGDGRPKLQVTINRVR
jgi:peptidyl-prolyl cis-trans isomerase B (cyclophilin B)